MADVEVKVDAAWPELSVPVGGRIVPWVAAKLTQTLVEELRNAGISAVPASDMVRPSNTTLVLKGEFLTIDQGNQTARVWVGFGFGGSELRTRIQAMQNHDLVAQAETATKSGLKPGMLTSIGVGAAADSGAAVVAGAAGTGISEAFMATVHGAMLSARAYGDVLTFGTILTPTLRKLIPGTA